MDQRSGDGRFSGWRNGSVRDQFLKRISRIFEMLDAKIASALNKIIQNSHFKKKVSLEEQKTQKEDRFLPAITLIYFPSIFVMIRFRNSMRDGMKFHYL